MDIHMHYTEAGSGRPLILLHGNGEDSSYFKYQIPYFAKRFRVIAPDTRGHGKTPRGSGEFSIRRFSEDLHDFMKELNIENADILGFSDGANTAMIFAMKYPEMTGRLILNGGNLFGSGVKASVQIPIIIGFKIASLFAAKSEKAARSAEMLGLMVNDPDIKPEELSRIKSPTLVIAGTNDMIKKQHTRLICDSIPNAALKFVSGDHFAANKNPAEFNAAAEAFLAKQ